MAGPARHDDRIQREFTRQAESFAASQALAASPLVAACLDALGDIAHARVLDLAAGPGLVASALASRAREVVALDLTHETLRVAARRFAEAGQRNVALVRGNGLRLPFDAARFGVVVIRLALHHLEDPTAVLREAHRSLEPGGRLLVIDLLAPEDPEEGLLLEALERLRDPSHVHTLGEARLSQTMVEAGFEIGERKTFTLERRFSEWAAIIADPVRTDALRIVMQALARAGLQAGIGLREQDDDLVFDYRFGLVVGER